MHKAAITQVKAVIEHLLDKVAAHLPQHQDTIPTVLHYDGANNANNSIHMGTEGVRDVFVIDAKHLVPGFGDTLFNWTPREDVILVTNYDGKLKDISLTNPEDSWMRTGVGLDVFDPKSDVLVLDLTVKQVGSMITIYHGDFV